MTEHGLLMNDEMMRAYFAGRKTQTRRPMRKQPTPECNIRLFDERHWGCAQCNEGYICPYGQPGDVVWFRECFMVDLTVTIYRANNPEYGTYFKWTPSIHMPRRASRVAVPLVDVRVERVQDITVGAANAEGCPCDSELPHYPGCIQWFQKTWNSIYEKRGLGWDANPWVWVLEWEAKA